MAPVTAPRASNKFTMQVAYEVLILRASVQGTDNEPIIGSGSKSMIGCQIHLEGHVSRKEWLEGNNTAIEGRVFA
ncbi:hypothetical protein Tco_0664449 [Tanacetum coccineum]